MQKKIHIASVILIGAQLRSRVFTITVTPPSRTTSWLQRATSISDGEAEHMSSLVSCLSDG
jgi:hypothetical protein